MEELKIVVIGGVAAGPKAAARAKRCCANAKVTLIERGDLLSYGACGLPYFLGGVVGDIKDLIKTSYGTERTVGYFEDVKDMNIMLGWEATKIDRENKKVVSTNVKTGEVKEVPYDKLVLATGARPFVPPFPGVDGKGVFNLTTPKDALAIKDYLLKNDVDNVIVIGSGLIGLEFSENVVEWGTGVTVVEMQDRPLPALLDPDIAVAFDKYLASEDLDVRKSTAVQEILLDENGAVKGVKTDKGDIDGQVVVVSVGVRSNVKLAQDAGLEVDRTIVVNEYLQTSDPDIYAGGDCISSYNRVSDSMAFVPLGSTANKHGRIIGTNVAGGKAKAQGIAGTAICKIFDWGVGRVGLSEKAAKDAGYDVVSVIVTGHDRPWFYPGHKVLLVKMIADKATRRVLGAQIVGPGDVFPRINALVVAVSLKATTADVSNFDYAYAPPFSEAVDVLSHAANLLDNMIDGMLSVISYKDAKAKIGAEGTVFLDVREPQELKKLNFPVSNLVNIPFSGLRARINEIPKDKEIILCCETGTRANEVQMVLKRMGYENTKFLEAGIYFWPWE